MFEFSVDVLIDFLRRVCDHRIYEHFNQKLYKNVKTILFLSVLLHHWGRVQNSVYPLCSILLYFYIGILLAIQTTVSQKRIEK